MADGSTEFIGTSTYLTITSANMNFGSNAYTVEFFYSIATLPTADVILFGNYTTLGSYAVKIWLDSSGNLNVELVDSNSSAFTSVLSFFTGLNRWRHVAVSGSGVSHSIYVDGQGSSGFTSFGALRACTTARVAYQASGSWNGAISNLRVVLGSQVYSTANITVPTSRLTAVSNTKLLTCLEHNSLTDQSGLSQTITVTGSPRNNLASPITTYSGTVSREDTNPYLNDPNQIQRWQTFDNRTRYV